MIDKKLLFAIGLSLVTVWFFNRYTAQHVVAPETAGVVTVGTGQAPITPGQPVKVPTSQELYKPLDLEVTFAEKKLSGKEKIVDVQTKYCTAMLSSYGAVLTSLDFKEHEGKANKPLRTIFNKGAFDETLRKQGCFLVAFDKQTPYEYALVDKRQAAKQTEVIFKAETDQWAITKTYVFYHDSYQIDLALSCEPKGSSPTPMTPRLFFAAPIVGELEDDAISLFAWNENKQSVETTELAQAHGMAWFWSDKKPMFGVQDRYFVHTLISDSSKFVQRAFIKQFNPKTVFPVLEGPSLTAKADWKLSFYMGPKLFDHMNAVDDRLEEVLSFGWLSWLCKLLLKLLSWIYDFVGNFGIAIIIMTIVLKLPFTPLSIYSRKQMEAYQYYLPSINKIRMKFRHDLKMQHEELMKFYKDHNISPTTQMVGCLPLLIQMPILFALYRVLNNYLDLYQAPFAGWIVDLSAKDPYYVIPVLMGLSMLWQQQLTPAGDGKQKVMMSFMAIVMTVVFANFPVGLVLYWFMNNVLTIGEDYLRKFWFR